MTSLATRLHAAPAASITDRSRNAMGQDVGRRESGRWMPVAEAAGAQIVTRGVVPEQQTMALDKVFWSHFSPNLGLEAWIVGLLVGASGLNFAWGVVAIVVGNALGALPVGFAALMGPVTGLTQIENSRFAFGRDGTRVPALLNYLMCIGFNAASTVPGTLALIALLAFIHPPAPFWLALLALQGCSLLIGAYGHHLVQALQKFVGYYLLAAFVFIGYLAATKGSTDAAAHAAITGGAFGLALAIVASNAISWAPYSSDYTRYVARTTSKPKIFWLSYGGIVLSCTVMEVLGLVTITHIPSTAPADLIVSIGALCGGFAPLALFAIVISTLASNAVNDTTASYSLISAGATIPRTVSAVVTGALGYFVAVIGAGSFTDLYMQFLLVMLYWVSPWVGIALTDWVIRHGDPTYAPPAHWAVGATIFVVVTLATIALFSATTLYTGPVAKLLGGIDVGYVVGFFAAAGLYWLAARAAGIKRQTGDAASETFEIA